MKKGIFIKLNNKQDFFSDIHKMAYDHYINNFLTVGSEVWVSISEKKPTRTDAQNRFYWAYLGILEREIGDTAEMLHEEYKEMFLPSNEYTYVGGKVRKIYPSTTDLSIKEFCQYIREIEVYTGIPAPNYELFGLIEHMSKNNMI